MLWQTLPWVAKLAFPKIVIRIAKWTKVDPCQNPVVKYHSKSIMKALKELKLRKRWSFPFGISSVNVTKSAGNCGFGHIYWRNPQWKTFLCIVCCSSFFVFEFEEALSNRKVPFITQPTFTYSKLTIETLE